MSEDIMAEPDSRIKAEILGVVLGTADGWDHYADNGVLFHNFIPEEKFNDLIQVCEGFAVDFETGIIEGFGGAYNSDTGTPLDAGLILLRLAVETLSKGKS